GIDRGGQVRLRDRISGGDRRGVVFGRLLRLIACCYIQVEVVGFGDVPAVFQLVPRQPVEITRVVGRAAAAIGTAIAQRTVFKGVLFDNIVVDAEKGSEVQFIPDIPLEIFIRQDMRLRQVLFI